MLLSPCRRSLETCAKGRGRLSRLDKTVLEAIALARVLVKSFQSAFLVLNLGV